jgi:hypothetical protein
MKTSTSPLLRWNAGFGMAMAIGMAIAAGARARANDLEGFPNPVAFETGRTQLMPGDSITIQSVRGTTDTFQTNETYCVEGTYTLSSHEEADLALFVTSKQNTRTKIDPRQKILVKKGSGTFKLIEKMQVEGNPHVSFYPAGGGEGFGGVYFGKGEWLWTGKSSGQPRPGDPVSVDGANRALLDYLGNPVEPPANLDAAYAPAGLREAVTAAAGAAGISLRKIAVDDSEFPYMVWVAGDEAGFTKLKAQFGKMERYEYYGSVGDRGAHAFTIIPRRAWPEEAQQRIYRRATLRMQVFYDRMAAGN